MIIDPYRYARAFNPFDYGTVVAWYSDTGSDPSIWPDLSGNGNDATQATMSKQPAIVPGALNGLQVRSFDGVDDLLLLASEITTVASTSLFVADMGNSSALIGRDTATGYVLYFASTLFIGDGAGGQVGSSQVLSGYHLITVKLAGGVSSLYVNSVPQGDQSLSNLTPIAQIGKGDTFTGVLSLAETVIFPVALDDTARPAAEAALMAKWGIAA